MLPFLGHYYPSIQIQFVLQYVQKPLFISVLAAPEECVPDIDRLALKEVDDNPVELRRYLPKRPNITLGVKMFQYHEYELTGKAEKRRVGSWLSFHTWRRHIDRLDVRLR